VVVDSDGTKNYKLFISIYQPVWQLRAMCEMGDRLSIAGARGKVTRVRYSTQRSSGTCKIPLQ